MTDANEDASPVFIQLPDELVQDGLLDDVPSARVIHGGLRGPVLDEVFVIMSNTVSVTSGLVTIGVAYDQIAVFAKSLLYRLGKRQAQAGAPVPPEFSLRITFPAGSLDLKGDSTQTLQELIKTLQSVHLPE